MNGEGGGEGRGGGGETAPPPIPGQTPPRRASWASDMTPEELIGLAVRKVRRLAEDRDAKGATQDIHSRGEHLLPRVDDALEQLRGLRYHLATEGKLAELELAEEFLRACKRSRSARLEALRADLAVVQEDVRVLETYPGSDEGRRAMERALERCGGAFPAPRERAGPQRPLGGRPPPSPRGIE